MRGMKISLYRQSGCALLPGPPLMVCSSPSSSSSQNWRGQEEGGYHDPENVSAAKNYAMTCLKLGGAWVSYDTFTQRLKFLYMEHGKREILEKAWTTYSELQKEPGREGGG